MIEFLFLDLDDTILDFHKAERVALSKTIQDFGVEPTDEVLEMAYNRAIEQGADPEFVKATEGGMTGVIGILRTRELEAYKKSIQ